MTKDPWALPRIAPSPSSGKPDLLDSWKAGFLRNIPVQSEGEQKSNCDRASMGIRLGIDKDGRWRNE
eukprot:2074908-Pyramimonas_sp.AAC.1